VKAYCKRCPAVGWSGDDSQYYREAFYNAGPSNAREKVRTFLTTEPSRLGMLKTSIHRKISY